MARRVFITGASGFVGSAMVDLLLKRGFEVNALTHRAALPSQAGLTSIAGGLFDDSAIGRGLSGCDAVIHLVGIIAERPSQGVTFQRMHVEGTQRMVAAAERAGVSRYLHMSSLGARTDAPAAYHRTKFAAEQAVRRSDLDWTIFRPSLIHGPRGQFMRMEARWARGTVPPFVGMPYFSSGWLGRGGAGWLQPVFVNDVARAFVDASEGLAKHTRTYELGGSERVSWPQLHEICAKAIVGRARRVVPFPVPVARLFARIGLASLFGFNGDQVEMSQEDNTCDLAPFIADFAWQPAGFSSTLASYAAQL